jgi:hypothetical protein
MKDPLRASYATSVLLHYDTSGPDKQDATTLLQMTIGNPTVPTAYLCCTSLNGSPHIDVLYMPSKYTPALDGCTTPWDNKLFGFLGEILRETAMIVPIPTTALDLTLATCVYDDATLKNKLVTLGDGDLFPSLM